MKLTPPWWERKFLTYEFLAGLLLAVVLVYWAEAGGGRPVIYALLKDNRADVYQTLASVFGSLLGFVLATISIIIAFAEHERLAIIRNSTQYSTLWSVFISATRWLGFATIISVVALIIDRDQHPVDLLLYLNVMTTLVCTFRIWRCVWVLENIISLVIPASKKAR